MAVLVMIIHIYIKTGEKVKPQNGKGVPYTKYYWKESKKQSGSYKRRFQLPLFDNFIQKGILGNPQAKFDK